MAQYLEIPIEIKRLSPKIILWGQLFSIISTFDSFILWVANKHFHRRLVPLHPRSTEANNPVTLFSFFYFSKTQ